MTTKCFCLEHRKLIGFQSAPRDGIRVTMRGEPIAGPFKELSDAEAWVREQPTDGACRAPSRSTCVSCGSDQHVTSKCPYTNKPRVRSGPNIPENDRRTVAVKLRLPRGASDRLRELAETNGVTLSTIFARIIMAQGEADDGTPVAVHDAAEAVPAFVHKNVVDAYERQKAETSASTKHVIEELRSALVSSRLQLAANRKKLAKYEKGSRRLAK